MADDMLLRVRVRNNGRTNVRHINGKLPALRSMAADPAEDVLRAIENNGEVTLPMMSADGFHGARRQYRFVLVALFAAYVLRRQFIRVRRSR
jgi:hypothetical protein